MPRSTVHGPLAQMQAEDALTAYRVNRMRRNGNGMIISDSLDIATVK